MVDIIVLNDLPAAVQSAELVSTMLDAANAKASRVAPCLADTPTADQLSEAKLVLIGAIMRWSDAGSGAVTSQTAGVFGMTVDTRQRTGFNLWPSEIADLQNLCTGGLGGLYSVSLAGDDPDATWVPPNLGWASPYGTGF